MRVVDEMSYAQMATAIRCPVGTIMSRLFHARRGLRSKPLRGLSENEDSADVPDRLRRGA